MYTSKERAAWNQGWKDAASAISFSIQDIVGGYPENEEERPKLGPGLHANDAKWAAMIAREVGGL